MADTGGRMTGNKPTLILPPRFSDDSNALWRAAIGLGWDIERLQGWRVPDGFCATDAAIYGESLWANFVAEQLGLALYEPPLPWLATLPREFVGRRIEFGTLEEARDWTFPRFVKPAGDKAFEARVYESAAELPPSDDAQESLFVLGADVVQWEVEYRFFVLDGKIETGSSYWRGDVSTLVNGIYEAPDEEMEAARNFTSLLLRKLKKTGKSFDSHGVVIDVGIIRGVGWAVVEANPAFASGLYGSDAEKVLKVVAGCAFWRR